MHTSFDLQPDVELDTYRAALENFSQLMKARGLVVETGPVMERCRHPIMDTDTQRDQQYFFVMSFADREQCDAAVRHIQSADPESDPIHRAVYENIVDPIFTCWIEL